MAVEGHGTNGEINLIPLATPLELCFARGSSAAGLRDVEEVLALYYHFVRAKGITLLKNAGYNLWSALAWINERMALLLGTAVVAICNFYYLEIRYYSALHPEICRLPNGGALSWSRFNNSPDAVALPRAFLFLVLVVAVIYLFRGGTGYPRFVRFVFPRLYGWLSHERFQIVPRIIPWSIVFAFIALGFSSLAALVALCS